MKRIILLGIFVILLSSLCYADTYSSYGRFTPTLSNVTYNLTRTLVCDSIFVGTWCFNITGGSDAYDYCNTSAGHIFIQFNSSPVIDTFEPYLNQTMSELDNYEFNITVNDTDGYDVNWYVNGSNQSSAWDSLNFDFIGNYSAEGNYNITVNVSDGGGSDTQSWIVTFIDVGIEGGPSGYEGSEPAIGIILSDTERCGLINGTWMIENETEYCTLEPKQITFIESVGEKIWPSYPIIGFIIGIIALYLILGVLIELCKKFILFKDDDDDDEKKVKKIKEGDE